MGRVYLCLGKNAEVPYYFERARMHIWNVEELCYFVRENAWVLDSKLLGEELTDWVAQQCGLTELAAVLKKTANEEKPVTAFVRALFLYTGYFPLEEVGQVEKILRINDSSTELERTRARGDYYLQSGRFAAALQEYDTLLSGLAGMDPAFLGKVYHNRGVACAQLFFFERAAESFEKAWKLTKSKVSAKQYLAAKRFELGEQEYVDFLAERPDLYEASLTLEEEVRRCEGRWKETSDAAYVLQAADAYRDGAAHTGAQMVEEKLRILQDEYRNHVAV